MVDFYHYNSQNFKGENSTVTIATGPVIIDGNGNYLVHRAESTGKYQFTGGRLDDSKSSKDNAVFRPFEDLNVEIELINKINPFIVSDEIKREGVKETLILIHYLAKLKKNSKPKKGEWKWFSLEEIIKMEKNDEVSSPNIRLACEHFSKYNK